MLVLLLVTNYGAVAGFAGTSAIGKVATALSAEIPTIFSALKTN